MSQEEIKAIIAQKPGICFVCGTPIYAGDAIVIVEKDSEKTMARHIECDPELEV